MKLRTTTLTCIAILALALMASEYFITNSVVKTGFDQIEREATASDVRRVKNEILRQIETLDSFLWDWSSWDDTYVFSQDGNEAYVESNLLPATFKEQALNAVIIKDKDRKIMFGLGMDNQWNESKSLLHEVLDLTKNDNLPIITEDDDGTGGLAALPEGILLLAQRKILQSGGEGPPSGTILMARLLTDTLLQDISTRLELSITMHVMEKDSPREFTDILQTIAAGQDIVVIPRDESTVDAYTVLRDIRNVPRLMIQITEARTISGQGQKVALLNYFFLVAALIAFSLLMYFLLQKRVLTRVEHLNAQVKGMDMSGKVAASIAVTGQDEISELSVNINRMLQQIFEDQQSLRKAHDELEDKVAQRTEELEKANTELVCLDKAKSHFVSSTSHELRTPLTSIFGFIKLLERAFIKTLQPNLPDTAEMTSHTDRYLENFRIVRFETERLGRLIDDLLDLNKIEAGRMEWRDTDVPVRDVIHNAAYAIAGQFEDNPYVQFIVDAPEISERLHVDKDRIQQVLINLLNNAAKFTERGHVRFSARLVEDREIEFEVDDTGDGIAEKDWGQIFDIFYQAQADSEYSGKTLGTGLGLAICKEIVEHYGGRIWVESELGIGSSFKFVLPVKSSDTAE